MQVTGIGNDQQQKADTINTVIKIYPVGNEEIEYKSTQYCQQDHPEDKMECHASG
jgi:hypothetical protein